MVKSPRVLFVLGFMTLSLVISPRLVPASTPPGESNLPDAHQTLLTTFLAEKQPYAYIIGQALTEGMDCEEVALFLCKQGDNDPALVYEIVYAAVTGGCDAGKVVSGALRAGADLHTVVRGARVAGASREAIAAAAEKNGYSPEQIANAFAATSSGEVTGGGRLGEGSIFNRPIGVGPTGSGSASGGSVGGGAGGGNASPYKP